MRPQKSRYQYSNHSLKLVNCVKKKHLNDQYTDIFSSLRPPYLLPCCGKSYSDAKLDGPSGDFKENGPINNKKMLKNNSCSFSQREIDSASLPPSKVRYNYENPCQLYQFF